MSDPMRRSAGSRRWWGRGSRGAVEAGAVVVVGALVAGGLLGSGLAGTVVDTFDGLTWLADEQRGEAVQVNPVTGGPQARLRVAPGGHELVISQRDDLLVVTDATTGTVTVIDIATLSTAGSHAATGQGAVKVLLGQGRMYVVDRQLGTIQRVDPATAADIGNGWAGGAPLADAVIDGRGSLWALRHDGVLFTLAWSDDAGGLIEAAPARMVASAGPQSVLVPHDQGVTVFAPEAGTVTRIRTGGDLTVRTDRLTAPVHPAPDAPADLVPVAVERTGTVLVLDGGGLLEVDTAALGCPRPGQPVVHRDLIHVPCLGQGRVIVLGRDGTHQPPDITLESGSDPQLVLDDGRLIIHTNGTHGQTSTGRGVVIEPDGTSRPIHTRDDDLPVRDPDEPPPTTLPPTSSTSPPGDRSTGSGGNTRPPGAGGSSPRPLEPPTGVSAEARPDGTILVRWRDSGQPDRYRILRHPSLTVLATASGAARSATVTTIDPGQSVRLVVEADFGTGTVRSQPSNQVTAYTAPGAPTGITISVTASGGTAAVINVDWSPGGDNGSPLTGQTVHLTTSLGHDVTDQVGPRATGYMYPISCTNTPDTPCGGITVDVEVHATNAAGPGPAATATRTYRPPPEITSMGCFVDVDWIVHCSVSFTGVATTINWSANELDGTTGGVLFGRCGSGGGSGSVSVIVSNEGGSDSASDTFTCPGGERR